MDMFSMAMSTKANPALSQMIRANSQDVWQGMSTDTRALLEASNNTIASIAPQISWEGAERAKTIIGSVFDPHQLERHRSVFDMQTSNLHTAHLTLANPQIAKIHALGQTEAYGEQYNALRNNLLYNRVMSGISDDNPDTGYVVTNYADNAPIEMVEHYNDMSTFQRSVVRRNWSDALHSIFEEGIDIGSVHSGTF